MKQRALSLDVLRGYAIITMILSGTIATWVLPGWMSHAQVLPSVGFDPSVPGLTWVDLVFPFFIFSMGAALPFSLGARIAKGEKQWRLVLDSIVRGCKLTFFAIFIQHIYPHVVSSPADTRSYLIALLGFVLLFGMFLRIPFNIPNIARRAIEFVSFGLAIALVLTIDYAGDREFGLGFSNIIILVLANLAIFGSIVYIFSWDSISKRLIVMPFVAAVLLCANSHGLVYMGASQGWLPIENVEPSWVNELYNFTPIPWMYQFTFLKYLLIFIPGTIAGDYLKKWCDHNAAAEQSTPTKWRELPFIILLSVGIVVFNLYALYTRQLTLNIIITSAMLLVLRFLVKKSDANHQLVYNLFMMGAFLLLLGLTLESYEGGIRKDYSTFSYYFTTSGLASFALITFFGLCDIYKWRWLSFVFQGIGQNPMVAYVSPQLFVTPVFGLIGLQTWIGTLQANAFEGFMRGAIITTAAIIVTIVFTKLKFFWRT